MQKSTIEWVRNQDGSQGFTSNPIRGKCHHNCKWHGIECYAETIRKRFKQPAEMSWHPETLEKIRGRKKPATVFIGSMYDVFAHNVPTEYIQEIIDTAKSCPKNIFLFLTKYPDWLCSYDFPNNCWIGTTITGKKDSNRAFYLPSYQKTFISYEPLIEQPDTQYFSTTGSDWIIIGSLNHNRRPVPAEKGGTRKEWVEHLIEQADKYKIPVFIKSELYQMYPDLPALRNLPYLERGK